MNQVNRFLDALPRTCLGRGSGEVSVLYALSISGFYWATIVMLGGSLLIGRSPLVMTGLALIGMLSFLAYSALRKIITRRDGPILLGYVWFALACISVVLWGVHEPILSYLDVVSIGWCVFLAAAQVGCLLVGYGHGRPASVGIIYDDTHAALGFAQHLVGIRLFPVQVIEAVGLLGIGAAGGLALPFAQPGKVFVWFLLAYAVVRFGLEGLRGDLRPQVLGLSLQRWMALLQFVGALQLVEDEWSPGAVMLHLLDRQWPLEVVLYGLLLVALIGGLVARRWQDLRPRLLSRAHVREVREMARTQIETSMPGMQRVPTSMITSRGVAMAVSAGGGVLPAAVHVSLSLPHRRCNLPLLCELAAHAFPELRSEAARFTTGGAVLHVFVPTPLAQAQPGATILAESSNSVYGNVVRRLQQEEAAASQRSCVIATPRKPTSQSWCFAIGRGVEQWD